MRQVPAAGRIGAGGQGDAAGVCAVATGLGWVILGDFVHHSVQMQPGPGAMPVLPPLAADSSGQQAH